MVRRGDDDWFTIVKWSLYAMLNAEEMGISSKNVDQMTAKPTTPDCVKLRLVRCQRIATSAIQRFSRFIRAVKGYRRILLSALRITH